jgi:hydrogenase/urease accessory protein HupE
MAVGGALGVAGMPLPGVETGIGISAIMLGGMVAFAAKPRLWIAAVLVGASLTDAGLGLVILFLAGVLGTLSPALNE